MKKLAVTLAVVLVICFAAGVAKDAVIKMAIEGGVSVVTGLRMSIQAMKVGIIKSLVDIRGIKLYNPSGFADKIMCDMPEIFVDYDLGAIIKGDIHINDMKLNLKEFVVIKNKDGKLNLDSLKAVQAQKKPAQDQKPQKAVKIRIDNLELKIGKVVYKDYSRGATPSVSEFNINLDEKYQNITNPNTLVSLIVVKALMNTTIASLSNFDLGILKSGISDTLASAEKIASDVTKTATSVAKQTTDTAKKAVEGISKALPWPGQKK
jgi:uncharacterized protein involved in outer membrane biogenesis